MAKPSEQSIRLARILGPFEAFCLVVSAVLGSSIFIVPATVAAGVPFFGGIAAVWLAGGLFSLAGALTYAELGAMLPQAGGGYVYLEEAFGPVWSFLFVWTDFLLVRAGAAAAISVGFAAYVSALVPAPGGLSAGHWQACLSVSLILFLGLLNVLGTKLSGGVQVAGTIFKAGSILLLILLPWILTAHTHVAYLSPAMPVNWSGSVWKGMAGAMVPVLWSFGGWDQLSHMAEEVRNPEKNIARAFALGIVFISLLYVGATLAVHVVFPVGQVAASQAIGADFFRTYWGAPGAVLITGIVIFSAMTSAHMALMSGSRSCFAIGRGGLFPAWMGELNSRFRTPANSVAALTLWACLLVVGNALFTAGSKPLYVVLITYVMFGMMLFSGLIFAAALRLRRVRPEWARPYRAWGYPWTPIASIIVTACLLGTMLAGSPGEAGTALLIILAGYPFYLYATNSLRTRP